MPQSHLPNEPTRYLRHLEEELADYEKRFRFQDHALKYDDIEWFHYVEYPVEILIALYSKMSKDEKKRFQHLIIHLQKMHPAIERYGFKFPEKVDHISFLNGNMILEQPDVPDNEKKPFWKTILPTFDPRYNATLLQCLGFSFLNQYEFSDFIRKAANEEDEIPTKNGSYVPWVFGNGIEIWSLIDRQHYIKDMKLHFSGHANQVISIEQKLSDPENPLAGVFTGQMNPEVIRNENVSWIDGDYPIAFDCVPYDWFHEMPMPLVARVHLSAFAMQFAIVNHSRKHFRLPILKSKVELAREFLIPTGTLCQASENAYTANVVFRGTVSSCRIMYNMISKQNFTYATIQTHRMEIDTVIAQNSLERPLKKGDIVQGNFWLTGTILEILESFNKENPVDRGLLFNELHIAGVEYQDCEERIKQLGFGEPVLLKREPQNEFDPKAIAVLTTDHVKLGYIPRSENYVLAKMLDVGKTIPAHIVWKTFEPRLSVHIRIYLPDKED